MLLQRMRKGTKNFDWPKALPDANEKYNPTHLIVNHIHKGPIHSLFGKRVQFFNTEFTT